MSIVLSTRTRYLPDEHRGALPGELPTQEIQLRITNYELRLRKAMYSTNTYIKNQQILITYIIPRVSPWIIVIS
jgi:hypothetical protein